MVSAPIEIRTRLRWHVFSLVLSIIFFLIGLVLLLRYEKSTVNSKAFMQFGAGFIVISLILLFLSRKIFLRRTMYVLNDEGIQDHSVNAVSNFIPWKDIVEIKKIKVDRQKLIAIYLSNPEKYNQASSSSISKRIAYNNEIGETPVVLEPKGLIYDYYTFFSAIQRMHNLYKSKY